MQCRKGRIYRPFFIVLSYCLCSYGHAQNKQLLSFSIDSINISEATSLHSMAGHWSDKITTGNEALSATRIMVGFQTAHYSLQAIYRDDTYFRHDNETAQFIYQVENHLPLESGREYSLYIKADKASSKGFRLGYTKEINSGLEVSAFVSLLQATNTIQGHLTGEAQVLSANDYDFNFSSDLMYEDDPLYGRQTGNLSGNGYAIDLIIDYAINDQWRVNLQLLDVAGKLALDQAAYTIADATSDIKVYDDDGYLQYDPVISGREGYKDFTYKFSTQTHLSIAYQLSNQHSLIFKHHRLFEFEYQQLTLQYQLENSQLGFTVLPQLNAAGISFKHSVFSVGVETDSLDYKKMKYLKLNALFTRRF